MSIASLRSRLPSYLVIWGHSSNGRAGVLQALGCGFESHWLHGVQPPTPTEIIRWHELKFDFYKNFCYNN